MSSLTSLVPVLERYAAIPSATSSEARGFRKFAVPTETAVLDAAHTDDGPLARVCAVIDHAHRNRVHRGPRKAAGAVREHKASALNVNLHAGQCVDEREHIRAARLSRTRDLRDIGDIRR